MNNEVFQTSREGESTEVLTDEPVPPIDKFSNGQMWKICGNCRTQIYLGDKFCHECGKRIAWDK